MPDTPAFVPTDLSAFEFPPRLPNDVMSYSQSKEIPGVYSLVHCKADGTTPSSMYPSSLDCHGKFQDNVPLLLEYSEQSLTPLLP